MSLAQRIRDYRYAKGWGPDELATRAEISRTALYQIESGKTEQPRAATVRRIAVALSIPTEILLDPAAGTGLGTVSVPWSPTVESAHRPASRATAGELIDADAMLLNLPSQAAFAVSPSRGLVPRQDEVTRKFRELLDSPLGEGLARIVEETHRFLPNRSDRLR